MALNLAYVSLHTSPATQPGSGDAGGLNVVERATADALAELGHRVDLITRRAHPDEPDAVELRPGVTLRHLTAGPERPLAKSEIDAFIPEFSDRLGRLAGYHLVHSHHWMSGVAALPHARAWGVPHVQSYHSVAALPGSPLASGEPPESDARVPGEALVARESQAVVAISAAEAGTVIERCGADPARVHIVSPGVDHKLFRPLGPGEQPWEIGADKLGRPEPSPVSQGFVLFAARLQPLKGPDLAIRALAGVDPAIRPHLVIAGDVSADFAAYEAALLALVDELGLAGQVSFIGPQPRPELARLMRSARLVLVPSHSETFGLVALEAAASGTPVIAAAAGGLREAVAHGETGQLMDSRRPQDWADAITRLLTEPGLLRRQGVVARVHARRFDWRWSAVRLVSLYTDLLGGHR
ncbi:MAG: glycosyltransferase [Propionicimonas sp.]